MSYLLDRRSRARLRKCDMEMFDSADHKLESDMVVVQTRTLQFTPATEIDGSSTTQLLGGDSSNKPPVASIAPAFPDQPSPRAVLLLFF